MDNIDIETMTSFDKERKLYYFISVRTNGGKKLWGLVNNGSMNLSSYGKIAERNIETINGVHSSVRVEKYVIMPNHIHFLLSILKSELSYTPTEDEARKFICSLIEDYKICVSKGIMEFVNNARSIGIPIERNADFWHKGCHMRGVHSTYDYKKATSHIRNNVSDWTNDRYYAQ